MKHGVCKTSCEYEIKLLPKLVIVHASYFLRSLAPMKEVSHFT